MASTSKTESGATGGSNGNEVKTLAKGLAILDLLLAGSPVRTGDAAKALDMDKGGASRLLRTLVSTGYARQEGDRSFGLGTKLSARPLPGRPKRSLRARARPTLERLSAATQESIHLAIPADEHVFYVDAIEANFPLRVDSRPGTFGPVDCTAMGRIFVAHGLIAMPPHLEAHTARTITDPDRFAEELQAILRQGYALQDEEYYLGMRGVAAPIFDAFGTVVGAVGVSGPSVRIKSSDLDQLATLTQEAARSIPAE